MPHWPDNPPVRVERMLDIGRGDIANVSILSMGSHTATHMDAPLHFIEDGKGLDEMPLAAIIGRARVIEIEDPRRGFRLRLTGSGALPGGARRSDRRDGLPL